MRKFRCIRCGVLTHKQLCPPHAAQLFKGIDPAIYLAKPPKGPWRPC